MRRTDHILETIPSGTFVEKEGQRLYLPRYDHVSVYGAVNVRLDPEVILDKAVVKDVPGPIGPADIEFVSHSILTFDGNFTTVTKAVPPDMRIGDHLIAIVMHRDSASIPPAGESWNFLARSTPVTWSTTSQRIDAWHKIVEANDLTGTKTFSTTKAARMGLLMIALRSINTPLIALEATADGAYTGLTDHTQPQLQSLGENRFYVAASSAILALTGGDLTTYQIVQPPELTQYSPVAAVDNRLCVGGMKVGEGLVPAVQPIFSHQYSGNSFSVLSLLFRPEEV